jgi:hypothetical protein
MAEGGTRSSLAGEAPPAKKATRQPTPKKRAKTAASKKTAAAKKKPAKAAKKAIRKPVAKRQRV